MLIAVWSEGDGWARRLDVVSLPRSWPPLVDWFLIIITIPLTMKNFPPHFTKNAFLSATKLNYTVFVKIE